MNSLLRTRFAPGTARGVRVLPLLLTFVLAGCAGAEEDAAARTADAFAADLRTDAGSACALLAPRTRADVEDRQGGGCSVVLSATGVTDPGHRIDVTVAGHSAVAHFTDDTVFLALFDDGWKVLAAGCERASTDLAEPHDCRVQGG